MTHLRRLLFLPALVGVLVATAPGRGAYVTAQLNGTNIDNIINPGANVTINLGDGLNPSVQYKPGEVNWTVVSTDSAIPHNFITFCLELNQDIGPGQQYSYDLVNVENAPKPGSSTTGNGNGMGLTKANEIRQLWGTYYNSIGNDGVKAAAFQLDIWKIENDWGLSSYDQFGAGNFRATGTDQNGTAAVNQAVVWLDALHNPNNHFVMATDLVAMTNSGAQDQVTELVPAPPTFALAGTGLLSLLGSALAYRLRRGAGTAVAMWG
jgi:hypothetical protein